jgi:hypothetical protein
MLRKAITVAARQSVAVKGNERHVSFRTIFFFSAGYALIHLFIMYFFFPSVFIVVLFVEPLFHGSCMLCSSASP